MVVVQIEEAAVVPQIDEIAAMPGVDVLFVGPADLTLSLGAPGRLDHPEVLAVLRRVADACARSASWPTRCGAATCRGRAVTEP